jgi:hypothetical protein
MIELRNDALAFRFPEVHREAELKIHFQRTLRIPDDDRTYPLPPGLGSFPLRHVDDFARKVPAAWIEHGGVMLPMYQAEAMWLHFSAYYVPRRGSYPFAIKIATGKIDAVTGNSWSRGLHRKPQDYMVAPTQPWLDGYCVKKGIIRQFVAMPLGRGYTAEEQITGQAEHGGLQIMVYPMRRDVFERRFPEREHEEVVSYLKAFACESAAPAGAMGLAPGGRMKQEIYEDPFNLDDWDAEHASRCFVHIANSAVWREITGEAPPTKPPTARDYTDAGLPWFDYYDESSTPVSGSPILNDLRSVEEMKRRKRDAVEDAPTCDPQRIVKLRAGLRKDQVREGTF